MFEEDRAVIMNTVLNTPDGIIEANVPSGYEVVSMHHMKNGCCPDRPVLLTANTRPDGTTNYSCQCSCNGWKTSGQDTASAALDQYMRMSEGENLFGGFMGFVF